MHSVRDLLSVICLIALVPGDTNFVAQAPQSSQAAPAKEETARLSPDQLDSLVAPIALYPDPLLSQTLVASTYPLEIVQLQQWLEKNKNLKDQALADAAKKQDWDPSIQAMVLLPDAVKRLSENIKWTTDLGNAFLAQQSDVMDAVQRMRKKAKDTGNLKSTEQQKVETKVVESKQVIVVEQANPQVVYVPTYNPTVVYGAPVYAYPPIYYPPPGYYAAGMAISFGVGMAMGAAWGGGWGWGCGWGGHNNVYINNNNNFVRSYNNRQNISNRTVSSTWQHNAQHRGGAPYGDRATARQYGGSTRSDTLSQRQQTARNNQTQRANRQQTGTADRGAGTGRTEQAAQRDRSTSGNRQQASNRTASGGDPGNPGGGDRVGNRSVQSSGGSRDSSAFSGGGGGFNGNSARASSSRGSGSMGARSGGRSGGGRRR
jgi:hypothetical protein